MSCLISHLRWGSKLGSNSKIDFYLLWAELWHAARVKQLSPFVEVSCSRIWNRDGEGISTFRVSWDAVLGSLLLVQDCGSELMFVCVSSCAGQAQLLVEPVSPGSLCSAEQMWHFALPKLGLLALKNFHYVRCSSIFLGRNSSWTQHQHQWCGGGVQCPQHELWPRAAWDWWGQHWAPGLGLCGAWMDGWSIQLSSAFRKMTKTSYRRMVLPS